VILYRSALRPDHALLAVAVLLGALALWPFLPARDPAPLRPAAAAAEPPTLAVLPPIGQFAAIAERPLFSPSRRPVAVEKSGVVAGGLATRYRVLGVMSVGHEQRALLIEGTHRRELGIGDRLEGYTVARIEQDRVVLTSPAGEAVLLLRPAADPPAPR